jgi:hypothetical protein
MHTVMVRKAVGKSMVCFLFFVCNLFDDSVVSNSEYISWNDRIEVYNKMGRMRMEDVVE